MPATFDNAFAEWLTQHGQVRAKGVNVLQFYHPAFFDHFVSDYGEEFAAKTETGLNFIANPLGFVIDVAADNLTTEQRVMIRMDNANGIIMDNLRSLTPDELANDSVVVTYRAYLDTKRDAPAYDPLVLYVTTVKATRLAVEVEASTDPLPTIQAGLRYTLENFPTLAYL